MEKNFRKHRRIAALQCNFQSSEGILLMPEKWQAMGFDTEQLLHTHADSYSGVYDPELHAGLLRQYMQRMKELDMKVVMYMNCHILGPSLQEHYDDWTARMADGTVQKRYYTYPVCCLNSGWREYFFECIRSLAEFQIEGIFFDGPLAVTCHCPVCRELFRKRSGHEMDQASEMELTGFRDENLEEFKHSLWHHVKSVNPDWIMYFNESICAGRHNSESMKRMLQYNDWIGTEGGFFFYQEPKLQPYWRCSFYAKMAEAVADGRPTVIFFAGDHKYWAWFMHTEAESKLCYAASLANGASVWYGLHSSPANLDTAAGRAVAEMVHFDRDHSDLYENTCSLAEIAVYYGYDTVSNYRRSGETSDFYDSAGNAFSAPCDCSTSIQGALALLEHLNLPYDMITDINLKKLFRYKILLVPSAAMIRTEILHQLTDFVRAGGILIADGEFARYDEKVNLSDPEELAPLLGSAIPGSDLNMNLFNYLSVDPSVFQPDNVSGYIPSPSWCRSLRQIPEDEIFMRAVPPMDGPIERYPGKTEIPVGISRKIGDGRFYLLSMAFFEFYFQFQFLAYRQLFQRILERESKFAYRLRNALPGVSVTIRETQSGDLLVHLLNYVGSVRPLEKLPELHGLYLLLPPEWKILTDLRSGEKYTRHDCGGFLLPPLNDFAVYKVQK